MRKVVLSILTLTAFSLNMVFGQIIDPVSWRVTARKVDEKKYDVVFDATIDKGWHLYSSDLPPGGPIPTSFNFEQRKGFELIGTVKKEGNPKKEHDDIFNMEVEYFDNEARFIQEIKLQSADKALTITGTIEYQACFEDKCIFLDKDFTVTVAEAKAVANEPSFTEPKEDSKGNSLWFIFFYSFGWGLLGLLTPCVYPMIPMTVSFFLNNSIGKIKSILNALVFGISIITIYTSLGLFVSLFGLSPNFATILSSHWIPNLIFFILFLAFAASFFGLFEIILPSSLTTKTDSKVERGGFIGSFFLALTLILVSLSCVGPILGNVLIEASRGLGLRPIIGMLGFSLAFSIPFTTFAIFPSLMKGLPKSGGWLNSIKVVLAFLMLAFSLKFISIIDQGYHFDLFGREIFLSIWISLFVLMGMYLLGVYKFKNDSDLKHVGVIRLLFAIITFAFVIYLIPGMFGAPLKGLSGLIPPKTGHSFDLERMIGQSGGSPVKQTPQSLCDEPKYADILHLPHGLNGYFDYDQALACAREQKKPLFIDFVGHACANCKVMEQKVWSDPRVLEKLRNEFVIVALYVDERTKLPESEWITSTIDGKVKNTIGKKNADFQITRFNVNGQPYYVLLGNNEELLADPYGYNLDVEKFIEFLNKGIEKFNATSNSIVIP